MNARFMGAMATSGVLHAFQVDGGYDLTLCGLLEVIDPETWYVDDNSVPPPRTADNTRYRFYAEGERQRYVADPRCDRCVQERDRIALKQKQIRQVGSGQVGLPLAPVVHLFRKRSA